MKSAARSTFGIQLVTWVRLVAIAVMTIRPRSLRPQTHFSADFERFAAYGALGMLLALSYPHRRIWLLGAFLVGVAAMLEMGQSLVPSRDAHLSDFLFKAAGAVIGLVALRAAHTQDSS